MTMPTVRCPRCHREAEIDTVLTAQSNQNVIFHCSGCGYEARNIETSKG
ncbi:hypothetical protein QUF84_11505 [Fictibacillus enclensis]|uniref:Uncharacterized protein n=1 Tax=Fictibacillus solisalsi TaxID=459525 RepID=A0A1G9UJG5_9BACL|nr:MULTISPECIES: hypothetical protein [Fictibacillus]MDM5198644.1 hypothetical protein [Fictibacillus enclensis]MDM5337847.1 hypothetical protein [Fictibacillus enclensis]WHY74208.1 hypothetical protein QNH15_09980 [Fictibacillus enclensis]SCB87180.1 hypothetical protein GA0061096_1038 [Fictibacillus enclensis]SDM59993.1 hypothetical protein SAMN04488137_0958 [Fictibacillus solisalsi]